MKKIAIYVFLVPTMVLVYASQSNAMSYGGSRCPTTKARHYFLPTSEEYQSQLQSCHAETEQVRDQINRASQELEAAKRRERELGRELLVCENQRRILEYDSCSLSDYQNTPPLDDLFSLNIQGLIDIFVNGTCERPKTQKKKVECLRSCHCELEFQENVILHNLQAYLENVRGFMDGELYFCQEAIDRLQREMSSGAHSCNVRENR